MFPGVLKGILRDLCNAYWTGMWLLVVWEWLDWFCSAWEFLIFSPISRLQIISFLLRLMVINQFRSGEKNLLKFNFWMWVCFLGGFFWGFIHQKSIKRKIARVLMIQIKK